MMAASLIDAVLYGGILIVCLVGVLAMGMGMVTGDLPPKN